MYCSKTLIKINMFIDILLTRAFICIAILWCGRVSRACASTMKWPSLGSWASRSSFTTWLWTWAPRSPSAPCAIHWKSFTDNYLTNQLLLCQSSLAFEWEGVIDLLLPGQLLVLHEVDSDNDPVQSLPPWKGPFLDLERVLLPEPHVFVQSLQATQEFQVQSTENN